MQGKLTSYLKITIVFFLFLSINILLNSSVVCGKGLDFVLEYIWVTLRPYLEQCESQVIFDII